MSNYQTNQVFTPTSQAKLTFVERDKKINNELVDSLMTPGKQIIIYGQSGSGKSTLINNKLDQTYEHVITSRCTQTTTFEELLLNAFDQLNVYYKSGATEGKSYSIGGNLKGTYEIIEGQLQASYSKTSGSSTSRILPPQLTPQNLAQLLGAVKSCWVVEDFHKLNDEEKTKFAQNMKVFVDTASDYPDVKMIAIGAVGTARDVVNYDPELSNRVSEILVTSLTDNELHAILEKGQELLNVDFTQGIRNKIVEFSNGLGSICHQLALNLCFGKDIYSTSEATIVFNADDLKVSVEQYIQSNSDTLKGRYERATKIQRERIYNNGKIILHAMCAIKKDFVTYNELLAEIKEAENSYPPGNLTQYLAKLQEQDRGSVIVQNRDNNTYAFSDPFIKTYIQCLTESEQNKIDDPEEIQRQVRLVFEKYIKTIFE